MTEPPRSRWREAGDWAVGVLASPRSLQWGFFVLLVFVVLAATLYIYSKEFGFDNVMDRLGYVRPGIEQLRMSE